MAPETAEEIAAWIVQAGLEGVSETELLRGFCERVAATGLPVIRGILIVDTLHPVYEGRVFRWFRDPSELSAMHEYPRLELDDEVAMKWRQSPFHHLTETGGVWLRCHLAAGEPAPTIEDAPVRPGGQRAADIAEVRQRYNDQQA